MNRYLQQRVSVSTTTGVRVEGTLVGWDDGFLHLQADDGSFFSLSKSFVAMFSMPIDQP